MWLLLLISFLTLPSPVLSTTTVSASIGQNQVTINGYTSPSSRVELSSPKAYAVTYSDPQGYFIFNKIILPRDPSELCFSSLDSEFRRTVPVCIPPPPTTNFETNIGPILLPPTISIDQDKIKPNSTIISSGQAIPNSNVNINFYKVNDKAVSFPKEVQAYSLPSINVKADSNGRFYLNLPTAYSSNYRLYASTKFEDNYSPKSNTLIYILPSLFYIFLQQNAYLIFWLPLFLFTLIVFFFLLYLYNRPKIVQEESPRFLPAIIDFYPTLPFVKKK